MIEPLPILTVPHAALRATAKPVEVGPEVTSLVEQMQFTCALAGGAGLAAPQVGWSGRVFVLGGQPPERSVYINPVVKPVGEKQERAMEGCLSIPGEFYLVNRHLCIDVEAANLEGKTFAFRATGWIARVIQHENDHLNGRLISDHGERVTKNE